ncbi:hypothetical protein OTK49_01300 [Vibrio coralliirubri]|uniref:hypothetical protein n=1 Tax=Vibrio coralliirubri TaxID=1516159 RepID=UPI0022838FC8|nr:hypothetical protein [Vibrio coralliirubri]MCY9861165.1 hypothetical protein [Vibrio coralliirubri]
MAEYTSRKMFEWTEKLESDVLRLKNEEKMTYAAIAKHIGTTSNSVKHKVRRLQQAKGLEKYSHPKEKAELALPILESIRVRKGKPLRTLETHCGFGGMSRVYSQFGSVLGFDIVQDRIDACEASCEQFEGIKQDSEHQLLNLRFEKRKFDIVDVDPYGLPSRYFPHIFGLIDDGYLFLTFPMMGVAQINALTIKHYQVFWGIELSDKDEYIQKIVERLADYAYIEKKKITVEKVIKVDRIYRFVIKVEKIALTKLLGMRINRANS